MHFFGPHDPSRLRRHRSGRFTEQRVQIDGLEYLAGDACEAHPGDHAVGSTRWMIASRSMPDAIRSTSTGR